nr:testis anion transporter 1 isoform X3 [Columba livia]
MQTEEHFQAHVERKLSSASHGAPQISHENRRLQCSFSWGRFRKITLQMFPVLNWLFSYRFREWILRDLHAGLSVGMVQVPQGLLGVWLTRLPLPNVNGFLSAFCCSMTYVIFGTSPHISIGSFSILNVVVTNILKTLNFNQTLSSNGSLDNFSDPTFMKDYMEALTFTASITFFTGIIQLLLGCFCLGFVTSYVPKTIIDAYLTAAALHVIVSQFAFIFDIVLDFHEGPLGIFYNLFHFFLALPKANATSILLFLTSTAALRISTSIMINYKHSLIAFPMELLLVSDLQNVIVIIELTQCIIYYISKNISHITSGCCYVYRLSLSFKYSYKINCL